MKLTASDLKKLKEELEFRQGDHGKELREHLKTARAQGDLSENFEYTMAKKENNQNLSRIRALEKMIREAEIIEDTTASDEVGMEKKVTVYFPNDDAEQTFILVTAISADSVNEDIPRISNESPIGKAIFGHKVGEKVKVEVSADVSFEVEIRKVENPED